MRKSLITLVTAAAVATSGCSWFKKESTVVKQGVIDCAKQDLGQTIPEAGLSLLMVVAGIIFEGGLNWQADLDKLATKYGPDAVQCAAHIADLMFRTPADGSGASTAESIETPSNRASKYTSGRSFK